MAEELLLYIVPVLVVLASCLSLYLCSVRPGQVNQPDFAILSVQQHRVSKQSIASAAEDHHNGIDGRGYLKGSARSSAGASNGGNSATKVSHKTLGISGSQQNGNRSSKRVSEAVPSLAVAKQQRKPVLDLHESGNRRKHVTVAADVEPKPLDAQTDRSSGISSIVSESSSTENNGNGASESKLLRATVAESVKEFSAGLQNADDYLLAKVSAAPGSFHSSDNDDVDEGIALPVSTTSSSHEGKNSNSRSDTFDHSPHQRNIPLTKYAHAASGLPSSPYSQVSAVMRQQQPQQQGRTKQAINVSPRYSQQTHYSSDKHSITRSQISSVDDSNGNGWKPHRDAKSGGNSLVFVNSKQQQQLGANGSSMTAARSPPEKHVAAWNAENLSNGGIHNNYYPSTDSAASALVNGRRPLPYQQQRQHGMQYNQVQPSRRQFSQPPGAMEKQLQKSSDMNADSNGYLINNKNNDFPINYSVSPVLKPREQATIYQHKFSGVEHSSHVSSSDSSCFSNTDEQVQTDERLADWMPVILDVIFAEFTKVDGAADGAADAGGNYAGQESENRDHTNDSSCQTVLACGYAVPTHIDPSFSGLITVSQNDENKNNDSAENFSGECGKSGQQLLQFTEVATR